MRLELEAAVLDNEGQRPRSKQSLQQISFWIFYYQIVVAVVAVAAGFEVASLFVTRDTVISHLPPEVNLMVQLAATTAHQQSPMAAEVGRQPGDPRLPCRSLKMNTFHQLLSVDYCYYFCPPQYSHCYSIFQPVIFSFYFVVVVEEVIGLEERIWFVVFSTF